MKRKTPWIGFWILSTLTLGAIGFSLYAHTLSGVIIYDYNFDIFSEESGKLSRSEVGQVLRSGRAAVSLASWPLFPVLSAWMIAALVHLIRLKRNSTQTAQLLGAANGG